MAKAKSLAWWSPPLFALTLVGCATEVRVPVLGQFDGAAAAGEAVGRVDGTGDFWVAIPAGPRCSGQYDPYASNPTLIVSVRCSDGRTGEAIVTRRLDGLSGSAIVTLSDGRRGQFVFGSVTMEQAFGDGGQARTEPVARR